MRTPGFCPYCGNPLRANLTGDRPRPACEACSFIHFPSPSVAGIAAVVHERRVLLARRAIEPFLGHWTLPGGYLDDDETPWDAARRETFEECGLQIREIGLLGVLLNRDDPRRNGVVVCYLAESVGGEICCDAETREAAFVDLTRLPDQLGFANNRRFLALLSQRLRGG